MQLCSGAKKQRIRMSPDSKEGRPVTNHVTTDRSLQLSGLSFLICKREPTMRMTMTMHDADGVAVRIS